MGSETYTGKTLDGKYHLSRLLGKGGMGAVYMGEHTIIGKKVAVKFLHSEFAANEEVVKRFYREAQAAAAIGHDAIIDILDVGISPGGEPYLVMEYLEGESLGDMLARTGPLELGAACGIMEPALLALNAAHAKGIVHRDLKPDNIFIVRQENGPPKIKLIDFGISKFVEGTGGEKLTQTGSVMGTPAYMAPEQARGSTDLDHRADVYSMGVIFYEMLTAKLPFVGGNFTEIIISILTDNPIPPAEAYTGFPAESEGVLMRSLTKDPATRYQTALEFVDALRELAEYRDREEQLTRVASSALNITFAGGNLGDTASSGPDSGQVAANVLSQVARHGTPAGWTQTKPVPGSSKKPIIAVAAVAGLLTIGGIVAAVVLSGSSDPVTVPLAPVAAPVEPESTTVSIEVVGAPSGARVFFDDVLVTVNPFKVTKSDVNVMLKVEKEGFQTYIASVTPNGDQRIPVSMAAAPLTLPEQESDGKKRPGKGKKKTSKASQPMSSQQPSAPAPVATPAPAAAPEPAPTPEPKPAPKPQPPKKKSSLQKGAKGTKMADTFE